jgi:hypothetical protein
VATAERDAPTETIPTVKGESPTETIPTGSWGGTTKPEDAKTEVIRTDTEPKHAGPDAEK